MTVPHLTQSLSSKDADYVVISTRLSRYKLAITVDKEEPIAAPSIRL